MVGGGNPAASESSAAGFPAGVTPGAGGPLRHVR
jgi:hypothetical protein